MGKPAASPATRTQERACRWADAWRSYASPTDDCGLTDAGRPDRAAIAELAARYRLPFAQPEWLPDVIARYKLTPPPG